MVDLPCIIDKIYATASFLCNLKIVGRLSIMRLSFLRLPFLEDSTPPPFYQTELSDKQRVQLDKWFIGHRSQAYYLKRFAEFDSHGKLYPRWHWAGAFMTFGWLLYRKRYLDCFVYCVAGLSFVKVNIALVLAACEFIFISGLPADYRAWVRVAIGGAVWLFWAVQVGRWSDAYYYRMARREIADVLELYPRQPAEQKAHLAKHGGVSWFGLSIAYGLFGVLVLMLGLQFVPIIAMQKEQDIIKNSYIALLQAKKQVAQDHAKNGCPTGKTLDKTSDTTLNKTPNTALPAADGAITVVNAVMGIQTDCAIDLQITDAQYPTRYLNGKHMYLYYDRTANAWRCQSNLNKAGVLGRCL